MHLRWTSSAANDLAAIADYLFERTPAHAPRLLREICSAPLVLKSFPNSGRAGKKAGTRELLVPGLPYIVVYQVRGETAYVVRILHAAQEWPR